MIDLVPVLGESYKTIETIITTESDNGSETITRMERVPNVEFIANGILFLFVLILTGNILLRTIFPNKRR